MSESPWPQTYCLREDKPEWYLKLNPNGKVPALQHGSTVMFDSSATLSWSEISKPIFVLRLRSKFGLVRARNPPLPPSAPAQPIQKRRNNGHTQTLHCLVRIAG